MGSTHTIGGPEGRLSLPWWSWPLAAFAGVLVAAGSLSYAPSGRLNVLWLWLLWAGLPLLGALASLAVSAIGRGRPWLFHWRGWRFHWYPSRAQRWQMLYYLQLLWLVVGAGLLVGFSTLLLFSDLAFGWSSTLLGSERPPVSLFNWLSAPWQGLWPGAVPDAALLEATRYVRIAPAHGGVARAGDWWPFLMASLLFYNLLPRALLAGFSLWRWRRRERLRGQTRVRAPAGSPASAPSPTLRQGTANDWQGALLLNWELEDATAPTLGTAPWEEDEQTMARLLKSHPERLLWRVPANRSPVAELSDLIQRAREAGVSEQGLWVMADHRTCPERHLASWRHFAQTQALTWVSHNE
ncbi:DUF2868 domain-containing protein [Marinimicrobium locisalis]|uniref:DUF2868 domain-containing protein n=1 Tax=Marinimicrobium locisalis TaxID=546022 RepID=UPI003221986A